MGNLGQFYSYLHHSHYPFVYGDDKKWNEELGPSFLGSKEGVKSGGVGMSLWLFSVNDKAYCSQTGRAKA